MNSFRRQKMTQNSSRHRSIILGLVIAILTLAFVGGIVAWVLSVENLKPTTVPTAESTKPSKENFGEAEVEYGETVALKIGTQIHGTIGIGIIKPQSYTSCSGNSNVCITWDGDRKFVMTTRQEGDVTCFDMSWSALSSVSQEIKDCYNLTGHWYGGFQDWNQYWPMNTIQQKMAPYVAHGSHAKMYGGVLERYFVSSSSVGIFIEPEVPLHLSFNEGNSRKICLAAKYGKYPYINYDNSLPYLNYTICYASNIRKVHDYMSKTYIPRPMGIPDENLFRYPIWSTRALFSTDINETKLEGFVMDINNNGFSHSQIDLDDGWTFKYGDMDFNTAKFPNPMSMIQRLNNLGFRITLWLHPFFNIDSTLFIDGALKGYFIRQFDSLQPALVSWWRGLFSGILDVTNNDAVQWYMGKLNQLKTAYNVSSFNFDAGEVSWLPKIYSMNTTYRNPDVYSQKWAELAYESDKNIRHQEVRVGSRSQRLPIMVRIMDRDSTWTRNNGLKTIIPCVLTFGLIGYPFVLPDMIGGNVYNAATGLEAPNYPKPDLFMRWLQLNTFLPSMKFSVPPWIYQNTTLINEARRFVELHQTYYPTIVRLAREATITGSPIIRPLWWITPTDENTFMIDDEYLLGNDILVAPVVTEGAISRDIYLPAGTWQDNLRNVVLQGGRWYRNYGANLYELPYFTKL